MEIYFTICFPLVCSYRIPALASQDSESLHKCAMALVLEIGDRRAAITIYSAYVP